MAAGEVKQENVCESDTVVCVVRSDTKASTVTSELEEYMKSASSPICVVLNKSEDCTELKKQLTTAFPSLSPEIIIEADRSTPVQGLFAVKRILDVKKINNFVVFSPKDDLESLVVTMDNILTSAYTVKVEVYGDSYADMAEVLARASDDVKSTVEKECVKYLSEFTTNPLETVEVVTSRVISNEAFAHGFSTRKGGCSTYPSVSSLNLACLPYKKDSPLTVKENRRRLLDSVGASSYEFELAQAVHSNIVWTVGEPKPLSGYDAIVCAKPGIVIAAPAADCVTAILADPVKLVCAAVHSGWKGTLANVIGVAIKTMTEKFGCSTRDITAAVGPSIGACCYEVGEDVASLFSDHKLLSECVRAVEGKEKRHLDLQLSVRLQLEEAGVLSEHIDTSPSELCTLCNEDKFYSYRRDGRPFGTHVGFIGIRHK